MNESPDHHRKSPWLVILAILFCYVYFTYNWPLFRNANEYSRFYLTQAIVDYRRFKIDNLVALRDTQDKTFYRHGFYSNKAPGTSFLAVPVYFALRKLENAGLPAWTEKIRLYLIKSAVVAVPSALFLLAGYHFWRSIGPSRVLRQAFLIAYGLGTMAWTYSGLFYGHQLAAAAVFLAFVIIRNCSRSGGGEGSLVPAGFLCGLAFMIEYPTALIAFLLLFYAREVFHCRKLVYFLLAGALLTLMGTTWHQFILLTLGKTGSAILAGTVALVFLSLCRRHTPVLFNFVVGLTLPLAAVFYYHQVCFGGWFSFPYMFEIFGASVGSPFRQSSGFIAPHVSVLIDMLISPRRGFLFYSPFLILAFPGLVRMIRDPEWKKEGWFFTSVVVVYLAFVSSLVEWEGGWSMGPRHLVPILPFLATAAFFLVAKVGIRTSRWLMLLFFPLFVFSLAITFLGTSTFPYFPLEFENPVFEIGWKVLSAARTAPNLGTAAGLPPAWSLLPLAGVLLLLVGAVFGGIVKFCGPEWRLKTVFVLLSALFALLLLVTGLKLSQRADSRLSPSRRLLRDRQKDRISWFTGY